MAVVTPLNNPGGPEGDTVTVAEKLLNTEYCLADPLSAWWLGLAPATLEFWVRFPNERNQGKQAHPV